MSAPALAYDVTGDGPAVLLVHSGASDRRMWDGLVPLLAGRFRVIRPDLRGYGQTRAPGGRFSHARDLGEVLDYAGVEDAIVVGASFGGLVALELALTAESRVRGLVLLAPLLLDQDWYEDFRSFAAAEDAALEAGDLDGAVRLNMERWVAPEHRAAVAPQQHLAFELQLATELEPEELDPPAQARLGEIAAPTVVAVGEHDLQDFRAIAERLAAGVPGARLHRVPGAWHLLSLDEPELVARLVESVS